MSAPGPVLKANSLSNLEQEKSTYRYTTLSKVSQAAEDKSGILENMLLFTLAAPPGGHYLYYRKPD